jgi:hypothetical protein
LHRIAVVMSVFAALLVVAAIATRRRSGTVRQR